MKFAPRWLVAPLAGALAMLLLLIFLSWASTAKKLMAREEGPVIEGVSMVKVEPDKPEPPPPEQQLPKNLPPPPPDAPPALARPEMPSLAAPALANVEIDAGPVVVNVNVNTSGMALGTGDLGGLLHGAGGKFGGFGSGAGGGGGTGAGGGGAGYARGQSFSGKQLVPLSTARPQMPDWACKQKIRGWVEVVFTVMPNGRVQDVKIIDADPKGVYEAAAIESVSNWIYSTYKNAREVKQRVQMDPEDCAYNYDH